MFIVKFEYENNIELIGVYIHFDGCKRHVHCNISEAVGKYIITVFIKSVVFHHVGILWLFK